MFRDLIERPNILKSLGIFGGDLSRVLLIGEAPNRRMYIEEEEGSDALVIPRLVEMSQVNSDEFDRLFSRANILAEWPGRSSEGVGDAFPFDQAYQQATRFKKASILRGFDAVVLLGRRVESCFFAVTSRTEFFTWRPLPEVEGDSFGWSGIPVVVVPHPSGVSRWWNDDKNTSRAVEFWRTLVELATHAISCCRGRVDRAVGFPSSIERFPCEDDLSRLPHTKDFQVHNLMSAGVGNQNGVVDVDLIDQQGTEWTITVVDEKGNRHDFYQPQRLRIHGTGKSNSEAEVLRQAFAWLADKLGGPK